MPEVLRKSLAEKDQTLSKLNKKIRMMERKERKQRNIKNNLLYLLRNLEQEIKKLRAKEVSYNLLDKEFSYIIKHYNCNFTTENLRNGFYRFGKMKIHTKICDGHVFACPIVKYIRFENFISRFSEVGIKEPELPLNY